MHNHTVLDEAMDLRNALIRIVYPLGSVQTKEEFPAAAREYLGSTASVSLGKLEGFCCGPFMSGGAPQSGDFMLWEMLDQHSSICASLGEGDIVAQFPKLKQLHSAMRALPALSTYFESEFYTAYAQNNPSNVGLVANFHGLSSDYDYSTQYGPTAEQTVEF